MTRRRRGPIAALPSAALALALAALPLALAALGALSAPARAQLPARLTGQFQMTGRVTVAERISGEHPGDTELRAWSFTPLCPSGPCATVLLVRRRAGGSDTLVLHQSAPGDYKGRGRFYAPLRCGRHIWRKGESVPFTISLQVTAAAPVFGVPIATAVHATYLNRKRRNRTPCVAVPGHDGAVYQGQVVG
jgi:hypothetical protein